MWCSWNMSDPQLKGTSVLKYGDFYPECNAPMITPYLHMLCHHLWCFYWFHSWIHQDRVNMPVVLISTVSLLSPAANWKVCCVNTSAPPARSRLLLLLLLLLPTFLTVSPGLHTRLATPLRLIWHPDTFFNFRGRRVILFLVWCFWALPSVRADDLDWM